MIMQPPFGVFSSKGHPEKLRQLAPKGRRVSKNGESLTAGARLEWHLQGPVILGKGLKAGRHHLQFNGQLLNRGHLCRLLGLPREATQHKVIYDGLTQYGLNFLKKLNGYFCIALFDTEDGSWIMARGPGGLCPLWWLEKEGVFAFARDVSLLEKLTGYGLEPDWQRIPEYLAFQNVASGNTLFEDVRELLPGEVVSGRFSRHTARELLLLPCPIRHPGSRSPRDLAADSRRAMGSAVKRACMGLRDDGPWAIFLSGGVDSSLVAWFLRERMPWIQLVPITAATPGFKHDEAPYARCVTSALGLQGREITLDPQVFASTWLEVVQRSRMPLISTNQVAWWILCKAASEMGTGVAFSGEGADGWISGGLYQNELQWLLHRSPPESMGRQVAQCRTHLLNRPEVIRRIMEIPLDLAPRLDLWNRVEEACPGAPTEHHAVLYHVLTFGDRLLVRADMAASSFGVRLALPFLDLKWLRWISSIPFWVRNPHGEKKDFLKRLCRDAFGPRLADRRKVGFTFPIRTWIRDGGSPLLREWVEMLTDPTTLNRGIYRRENLIQAVRDRTVGERRRPQDWLLWSLVNLELWLRDIKR